MNIKTKKICQICGSNLIKVGDLGFDYEIIKCPNKQCKTNQSKKKCPECCMNENGQIDCDGLDK
jgi:hypothetical protein